MMAIATFVNIILIILCLMMLSANNRVMKKIYLLRDYLIDAEDNLVSNERVTKQIFMNLESKLMESKEQEVKAEEETKEE